MEAENRMGVSRERGKGKLELLLNGCRVLILQNEKSSQDRLYKTMNGLHATELYT